MQNNNYNYNSGENQYANYSQSPVQQNFSSLWANEEEYEYSLTSCLVKVFVRMFAALVVTAVAAWAVVSSPNAIRFIFGNYAIVFVLFIAELGLVIAISRGLQKMSSATANVLFFLYALLNGLTLSVIFLVYDLGVIYQAFGVTALMFAAMALFGAITQKNLTSVGSFCFMGLIGVIIASVVNIFLSSSTLDMIVCYVAVFVFLGLTAWDTQKIKNMLRDARSDSQDEAVKKISVIGALSLYLDFINLFLYLLRILGRRR